MRHIMYSVLISCLLAIVQYLTRLNNIDGWADSAQLLSRWELTKTSESFSFFLALIGIANVWIGPSSLWKQYVPPGLLISLPVNWKASSHLGISSCRRSRRLRWLKRLHRQLCWRTTFAASAAAPGSAAYTFSGVPVVLLLSCHWHCQRYCC